MQPKPMPIHNVFVTNLSYETRAKDFIFENANVVFAEIVFHKNLMRSIGYGFVSFNSKEAEALLSTFQGKVCFGEAIAA